MRSTTSNLRSTPILFLLLTAFCLLLTLPACGDPFARGEAPDAVSGGGGGGTGDTGGGGGGADGGTVEISFGKEVYPILKASCSCHGGTGIASFALGGSASDAYNSVKGLVSVEKPADSKLVKKGKGGDNHGGPAALNDADATTVLNWITQGAANN